MVRKADDKSDSSTGLQALTARQREVLTLFSQHKTAKVIALELELGVHTVNDHLAEIRRRLGVATSREAALLLLSVQRSSDPLSESGPQPIGIASASTFPAETGHGDQGHPDTPGVMPGLGGSGDGYAVSGDAFQASERAGDHGLPETSRGDGFSAGDRVHAHSGDRVGGYRGLDLHRRLKRLTLVEWTGLTLATVFAVGFLTAGALAGLAGILDLIQQMGDHVG